MIAHTITYYRQPGCHGEAGGRRWPRRRRGPAGRPVHAARRPPFGLGQAPVAAGARRGPPGGRAGAVALAAAGV